MSSLLPAVLFVVIVIVAITAWRKRRVRLIPGPGAAGSFYGFLNEDKRAALEVVVEERAGYRDAEDRDGDLPQLETPRRSSDDSRTDR